MEPGFTVYVSCTENGGEMRAIWDGDPQATPIWMGSDELLTLTSGEGALRRDMVARMADATFVRQPAPSAPEPEKRSTFQIAVHTIGAVAFIALGYALGSL